MHNLPAAPIAQQMQAARAISCWCALDCGPGMVGVRSVDNSNCCCVYLRAPGAMPDSALCFSPLRQCSTLRSRYLSPVAASPATLLFPVLLLLPCVQWTPMLTPLSCSTGKRWTRRSSWKQAGQTLIENDVTFTDDNANNHGFGDSPTAAEGASTLPSHSACQHGLCTLLQLQLQLHVELSGAASAQQQLQQLHITLTTLTYTL